jgi:lipopolysaccharide heptosyltransferase II
LKFDRNKVKKILVIKPAAIGDVLLCTPVIENLRNNFPGAEIFFLTQKYCKEALTGNPFLNRVLTYDLKLDSSYCLLKNIRKQKYDLVIDLFSNPRTALITLFSGAKYKVGYKFNWRSIAYNIKVTPRGGEVHNIEFNLDSLRALGLEVTVKKPSFYINHVHSEFAKEFFVQSGINNREVIGINPSGTWPTKVWYFEKFAGLAKKLAADYNILLFWGNENERLLAEKMKEAIGGNVWLIPPTDLKYMGALIKLCRAFLTNDTGPMHVSWILDVPTAAIFGPTNSHLQGHVSENSVIISNEALSCLGCNLTKIGDCPYNHKCMAELEVDYVYKKLIDLIGRTVLFSS